MNILAVLPMAFVMVAGPQILSSSFFATREDWRRTSAAYVLGAAISISIIVTLAFLLSDGATSSGASDKSIYYIVLALLLYGMLHTFTTRKTAEPPKWMGRLESATPPVRLPTRLPPATAQLFARRWSRPAGNRWIRAKNVPIKHPLIGSELRPITHAAAGRRDRIALSCRMRQERKAADAGEELLERGTVIGTRTEARGARPHRCPQAGRP
jgi:hypothetical protein